VSERENPKNADAIRSSAKSLPTAFTAQIFHCASLGNPYLFIFTAKEGLCWLKRLVNLAQYTETGKQT